MAGGTPSRGAGAAVAQGGSGLAGTKWDLPAVTPLSGGAAGYEPFCFSSV